MAQAVQITCINKSDRMDAHERIRNIGGANADGTRWLMTETDAIAAIEADKWSFFVEQPAGHRVAVIIATRLGVKYLKTTADGEQPDNLLALPECPSS